MIKTGVIFCGGYGSRLGSITKDKPKAMVLINKKPFLEHLLIQMKGFGIKKVFLLVGYKSHKIINYFSKNNLGIEIHFSYCPPEKETGYRLNTIKNKIKENFLLMYCDNYCSINLKKNILVFKNNESYITLSVCKKKNGNVSLSSKNKAKYFIKRNQNNQYVEIGYMICSNKILKYVNKDNVSINKYFNHKNISNNISAIKIDNNYLSISDKKRLFETRKFFKKKNIILIDRDGVLNLKNRNSRYITNVNNLKMNSKIISVLKKFPKMKYVCITNQAGIATGEVDKYKLKKINTFIKKYLKKQNINLIDFFVSTDHFNSKSFLRKPNPGLFFQAAEKYKLLLDKTFYIGDDPRDVLASFKANTRCVYIGSRRKFDSMIRYDISETLLTNLPKSIKLKNESNY